MTTKYWIELDYAILYERKIADLDDHLWRRYIECSMMAGEQDEDDYLPSLKNMALTLRIDIEQLETELLSLSLFGLLDITDRRWRINRKLYG